MSNYFYSASPAAMARRARQSRARVTPDRDYTPPPAPQAAPQATPTSMPSFDELLANDPLYGQTTKNLSAQSAADAAGRAASTQQLLIKLGFVPDWSGMALSEQARAYLGQDVNETTRSLAEKATAEGLSLKARLDKQHKDSVRALRRHLAARNMLRSGDTGYLVGEEALRAKQAEYDSLLDALGVLMQIQGSYASGEAGRQQSASQAAQEAAQRQLALLNSLGVTGSPVQVQAGGWSGLAAADTGVPLSAGFGGFDNNGNWVG